MTAREKEEAELNSRFVMKFQKSYIGIRAKITLQVCSKLRQGGQAFVTPHLVVG